MARCAVNRASTGTCGKRSRVSATTAASYRRPMWLNGKLAAIVASRQVGSSSSGALVSTHTVERVTAAFKGGRPTSVNVTCAVSSCCSHECHAVPSYCSVWVSFPVSISHTTVYAKCAHSLSTVHETFSVALRATSVWLAAPWQPTDSVTVHPFGAAGVEFTAWKFAVQVVVAAAGTASSAPRPSTPPTTMTDRAQIAQKG